MMLMIILQSSKVSNKIWQLGGEALDLYLAFTTTQAVTKDRNGRPTVSLMKVVAVTKTFLLGPNAKNLSFEKYSSISFTMNINLQVAKQRKQKRAAKSFTNKIFSIKTPQWTCLAWGKNDILQKRYMPFNSLINCYNITHIWLAPEKGEPLHRARYKVPG